MKVFIVYWHPEPKSFNGAMFRTACETLAAAAHQVCTSDLNEMGFNPVSGRHNFNTVKDPSYFKQQIEELHATENHGFAAEVEREIKKMEACDLMIWQFPMWWFGLPAVLKDGRIAFLPWGALTVVAVSMRPGFFGESGRFCR